MKNKLERAIYIGKNNPLTGYEFGYGMTGDYDASQNDFWTDDKSLKALVYSFPIEDLYFPLARE